ncbi:MAG: 3-dehydroquinate synthase [Intestinimonas sp.]|jgi:3-dehydroquinate synthase|nr:3-dehydroquinate synthase [Intestinimonas sp.]
MDTKILQVSLGDRSYDIHIGTDLLDQAGALCRRALPRAGRVAVVTDSNVGPLYGTRVLESLTAAGFTPGLITVPAGESSKCLARLGELYDAFTNMGLTRTDAVVALGGGVVGDLSGFAAATILRGVDFIQIPTTLLAQVDSSVGGKVAIDLPAGKNLAGAFWQPRLVVMDPACLNTLTDDTFADGMAEVIKYGCIFDRDFLSRLAAAPSRAGVMGQIQSVLYTCCDLKRKVVEQDERDTGARMLLNFGHTLGHAYERAGHYETWTHGQAVAAGMCLAAGLGQRLGVTPAGTEKKLRALVTAFGLPAEISCSMPDYAAAIGLDKKGVGGDISLILLAGPGCAVIHPMKKSELLSLLEARI